MSQLNAAPVSAPPFFPADKRLPRSFEQVQANADLQTREEKEFKQALNAQNGLNNTPPCCKSLHISLFFDGTNNNEKASSEALRPNPSNIARLYHAALDDIDSGFYSYYIPGVGTAFPKIGELDFSTSGLQYASGGENRINWALLRIIDAISHTLTGDNLDDTVAKSAVMAMESTVTDTVGSQKIRRQFFCRLFLSPLRSKAKTHQPKILKIKLFVYGFSRGAAEARAFINWLTDILDAELLKEKTAQPTLLGWPISIEFLGLCDTVASVGIARVSPLSRGHMGWADDNLALPDERKFPGFIRNCCHFVSAHEQRLCFPLDSVRRTEGDYPANTREVVYPGVHSDVGGGYIYGEQGKGVKNALILSQITLHDLYAAAFAAGAPLMVPAKAIPSGLLSRKPSRIMPGKVSDEFDIDQTLIDRFNAWRTTLQADLPQKSTEGYQPVPLAHCLEKVIEQQMGWMTAWRIGRFANGSYQRQPFFSAAEWNSGDADESKRKASKKHRDAEQEKRVEARKKGAADMPGVPLFEPALDQQQLQQAADEFRADYLSPSPYTVGMTREYTGKIQGLLDDVLGKVVYVLDPDDQIDEYIQMKKAGNTLTSKLFNDEQGTITSDNLHAQVCALYDDHIHDSRAWFMHSTLSFREFWGGYFRYRSIYSGDYANKDTSLLEMYRKQGEVIIGIHIYAAQVGMKAADYAKQEIEKAGAIIVQGIEQGMELSVQAQQIEIEAIEARNKKIREISTEFIHGVVDKTKQLSGTCQIMDSEGQKMCQVPVYMNMFTPVRNVSEIRNIYNRQEALKNKNQMNDLLKSFNTPVGVSQE